jgi:hypothetical protein
MVVASGRRFNAIFFDCRLVPPLPWLLLSSVLFIRLTRLSVSLTNRYAADGISS